MIVSKRDGAYDQGLFNLTCKIVNQINAKSYLHFLTELPTDGMDRVRIAASEAGGQRPTYTAFVIKAVAQALHEHRHLNCMIQETPFATRLVQLPDVTATVAVERLVDGVDMVFAPMISAPDQKSVVDLTSELRVFSESAVQEIEQFQQVHTLAKIARWLPTSVGWTIRIPSLSCGLWRKFRGGSFAVTSPGKYGGCDHVLPPWPWPLTISFGTVKMRPWVETGRVVPRKTMRLTITADRRLANGAPLARFAERVKQLLEAPTPVEKVNTNRLCKDLCG